MAGNTLFEVDASEILAKLHLAGLQAISIPGGSFIVNTGITKDNPTAKPDNPGDVRFNLANKLGEYQVGYATDIVYKKAYKLEAAFDAIQDALAKTSGDSSKLLDKSGDNKKEYEQYEQAKEYLQAVFAAYGEKDVLKEDAVTPDQIKQLRQKAKDVIMKKDIDGYQEAIGKGQQKASELLAAYMKSFAGADNVDAITPDKVAAIEISEKIKDSNDKSLVNEFEVQPISEQEKGKLAAQFEAAFKKDPSKDNCKQKICFTVKYSLNIDR